MTTALSVTTSSSAPFRPIAHIQERVAREFGLTTYQIKSPRRTRSIARPRQLAMYLAQRITRKSLPTIAEAFDRDHTTVLHAIDVMEHELARDPQWAKLARQLQAELTQEIGQVTSMDLAIDEVIDVIRGRLKAMARRNPHHMAERLAAIAGINGTVGGLS